MKLLHVIRKVLMITVLLGSMAFYNLSALDKPEVADIGASEHSLDIYKSLRHEEFELPDDSILGDKLISGFSFLEDEENRVLTLIKQDYFDLRSWKSKLFGTYVVDSLKTKYSVTFKSNDLDIQQVNVSVYSDSINGVKSDKGGYSIVYHNSEDCPLSFYSVVLDANMNFYESCRIKDFNTIIGDMNYFIKWNEDGAITKIYIRKP